MNTTELLCDLLAGNLQTLNWHLADFSDADMFVRPCPGANHAAWQIGHVAASEAWMVNQFNPGSIELPAGFAARFSKDTAGIDDPKAFATKAEILEVYGRVRQATIAWGKSLSAAQLDAPTPEKMRGWAPTVAHLLAMTTGHTMMHVGQIQVIRRKLGKPLLF